MNLISSKLDETGWRWLKQFVDKLPLPQIGLEEQLLFSNLVLEINTEKKGKYQTTDIEKRINQLIYQTYALEESEIAIIESL